ncbi:MAG: hypothetical protein LIO93_10410 [Bacteroidales bacterium]|nr:hypothetical protein [Bacteroidales bacterium]
MKKISFLIFLFVCLFSCTEDDVDYGLGEYYEEIATAAGEEIFILDNGKTLININTSYPTSFEAGQRIYLKYIYSDEDKEKINIRSAGRVTQGILEAVEEEKILNHPDDLIEFESAWLGNHYLNALFYIEHKSSPHSVSLWVDEQKTGTDVINIYFLHDRKDDERGVPSFSTVSFDLYPVLGEPNGEKKIKVHFNTTNYGKRFSEFNY